MANKLPPRVTLSRFLASFMMLVAASAPVTAVRAQEHSLTDVDSMISKSLAHIIVQVGKKSFSGTGFCIGSHDGTAYILTNKHVVGTDSRPRVVLLSDPDSELYGHIERVSTRDAAIIAIDNATCPPVTLSPNAPTVGTEIGIAGFPGFQLLIADDASKAEPSFHAGSVSALPDQGEYIEYDAQTDHGNSGSPLFDARTGVVVGIVTLVNTGTTGALQNNLSISIKALASFLQNSHANVVLNVNGAPQIGTPASLQTTASGVNVIDGACGTGTSAIISKTLVKRHAS
jgi:S1-C subfamily serine protease